jgi:Ca-activated chloride channel family protein
MTPEISTDINRPHVPPGGTKITAEVDVEPGEKESQAERHIALCIDTSGSMSGDKIERARDGVEWVFGLLDADDSFCAECGETLDEHRGGEVETGATTADETATTEKPATSDAGADSCDNCGASL